MAGRTRVAASALLGVVTLLGSPVAVRAQRAADLPLPVVTRVAILAPGEPGAIAGVVRNDQGDPIERGGGFGAGRHDDLRRDRRARAIRNHHAQPRSLSPPRSFKWIHRAPRADGRDPLERAVGLVLRHAACRRPPAGARRGHWRARLEPAGALGARACHPLPVPASPPSSPVTKDADDHSETAWRLRHARRSVLKDRLFPPTCSKTTASTPRRSATSSVARSTLRRVPPPAFFPTRRFPARSIS